MFSGIVQETGKVIEFVKEKDIYNLSIDCSSDLLSDLKKVQAFLSMAYA